MMNHTIELSTPTIKATRKLFDALTQSDLEKVGFSQSNIESLGELYRAVKGVCEDLEMAGEPQQ